MMKNAGICLLSVAPMRAEPSEKSEMTSQLLFCEQFDVIEQTEKWLHIRSKIDDYQGWVSRNMVGDLPSDFPVASSHTVVCEPYLVREIEGARIHIPGGSVLPSSMFDGIRNAADNRNIAEFAVQYLGAPYLWGGKTIFGIDCSGLVQVTCRMAGHWLPRDASQQAKKGQEITPEKARANDIVFFGDENGKITHTGILCAAGKIIHASGSVRIDKFDEKGIFNEKENKYTHKLQTIKRL